MKLQLTCLLALLCGSAFAQQKPYTIQVDTINLHGFIYDNAGKPIKLMHIQSAQRETVHNYFKAGAYTDASGYFELKGAKFNDTLTIGPDIRYDIPPYYNKGSRFIAVYLPPAKVTDINSDKPFEIVQKRRSAKMVSPFTIQPFTDVGISQNVTAQAEYPGGISALQDFIKQNLVYPEKAIKANAEGTVQVSFTVNVEGKVTDCKTLKGIGFDCDEELIHVLKKAAKWKPAVDTDRPVAVQEMVTLVFRLSDD
ncbi:MAG: energy transducer TonB [Mucilaginibacter sp.]